MFNITLQLLTWNFYYPGHQKAVRHLSVNMDGNTLVSGSDDQNVKLWHIASRQCSRSLPHKGILTSTEYAIAPLPGCIDSTDTQRFRPSLVLAPFEKTLFKLDKNKDESDDSYSFQTIVRERTIPDDLAMDEYFESYASPKINLGADQNTTHLLDNETTSTEVDKLKKINLQLYQYAVSRTLGERIEK